MNIISKLLLSSALLGPSALFSMILPSQDAKFATAIKNEVLSNKSGALNWGEQQQYKQFIEDLSEDLRNKILFEKLLIKELTKETAQTDYSLSHEELNYLLDNVSKLFSMQPAVRDFYQRGIFILHRISLDSKDLWATIIKMRDKLISEINKKRNSIASQESPISSLESQLEPNTPAIEKNYNEDAQKEHFVYFDSMKFTNQSNEIVSLWIPKNKSNWAPITLNPFQDSEEFQTEDDQVHIYILANHYIIQQLDDAIVLKKIILKEGKAVQEHIQTVVYKNNIKSLIRINQDGTITILYEK